MVPDILVELDALPRTLNGKVDRGRLGRAPLAELRGEASLPEPRDRASLPELRGGAPTGEAGGAGGVAVRLTDAAARTTAARTAAARIPELSGLIADILDTDPGQIPADVPLGRLGMNSISFTVLSTRVSERYGIEVLPTLFYRHPSRRRRRRTPGRGPRGRRRCRRHRRRGNPRRNRTGRGRARRRPCRPPRR